MSASALLYEVAQPSAFLSRLYTRWKKGKWRFDGNQDRFQILEFVVDAFGFMHRFAASRLPVYDPEP
jgi:hypothetical protein